MSRRRTTGLTHAALLLTTRGIPGNTSRGRVSVLPLCGKAPARAGGHGVLDATTDPDLAARQVSQPGVTGLGIRIQDGVVVLDIDPRSGGDATLAKLEAKHGPLPTTLTVTTGRGDGGRHLWYQRPSGRLRGRLPDGIDVKSSGYVVAPPSVHPDTGGLYRWVLPAAPMAVLPPWLATLITLPKPAAQDAPRSGGQHVGGLALPGSVVEAINRATSWHDVLGRHGWRCAKGDGDSDASVWVHPAATSRCSATTRGNRLYVWSCSTAFTPSAPGSPRGYSRAEALALLEHGGDLRALIAEVRATGAIASSAGRGGAA